MPLSARPGLQPGQVDAASASTMQRADPESGVRAPLVVSRLKATMVASWLDATYAPEPSAVKAMPASLPSSSPCGRGPPLPSRPVALMHPAAVDACVSAPVVELRAKIESTVPTLCGGPTTYAVSPEASGPKRTRSGTKDAPLRFVAQVSVPSPLMQPAVPAGCVSAPVDVSRANTSTACPVAM